LRKQLIRQATDSAGNVHDAVSGEIIPPDEITIDHIQSVAKHWNTKGRFQTKEQRIDWFNDPGNLRVRRKGPNSSEGARSGRTFIQETGDGYES
jgi:hypothetical protein